MATLTPTSTGVKQTNGGSGSLERTYLGGVAGLTAGECVSLDGNSKWVKAVHTSAILAGSSNVGIILHDAGLDQPCTVAVAGATILLGASSGTKDGHLYAVGGTAGQIVDVGDITTGDWMTTLGYGTGTADEFVIAILKVPTAMVA